MCGALQLRLLSKHLGLIASQAIKPRVILATGLNSGEIAQQNTDMGMRVTLSEVGLQQAYS